MRELEDMRKAEVDRLRKENEALRQQHDCRATLWSG